MSEKKERGFLSRLLFTEEEGKSEQQPVSNETANTQAADPTLTTTAPTLVIPGSVAPVVPGQVNPSQDDRAKFIKHMNDIMEKSNLPGPDYYEFMRSFQGISGMAVDDKTKTIMVATTLQSQGASKAIVLDTANQYLGILENDKTKYLDALASKAGKRISDLEQAITEDQKRLVDIDVEIQNLINEKTQLATDLANGQIALQETKIKAETNKVTYEMVFTEFTNGIKTDIQRITEYVQ